jgi:hypothetical protein
LDGALAFLSACWLDVTLGQQLIGVARGCEHDVEHLPDELERNVLVEEVAHGVDEDHPRLGPGEGQRQHVFVGFQNPALFGRGRAGDRV